MVLTSDSETTVFSKGNPFDQRNKVVCIGYKKDNEEGKCEFNDYTDFQNQVDSSSLMVFFNAKFDLHHYRRSGISWQGKTIWCCQLAEFLLSGQTQPYPSLNVAGEKYGLGQKVDVVKLEYWDKGINTDAIPHEVLATYCRQDVDLTYKVYLKQVEQFEQHPKLYKLFKLMCQDLLVLEEMEWNGLLLDVELCKARTINIEAELKEIHATLGQVYPDLEINFRSNDQLSAFLYGGTIYEDSKELIGAYKTGVQKGQPKYKNVIIEHQLPRLVTPLKGSEMAKEGYYSTNEPTLRKLKGPAAKKYVGPLLRLAELEKLNGTYYSGLVSKLEDFHWKDHYIHGQFNQVVAATGRLSSSSPNLQNFSKDCQDIFLSRFND